MNKNERIDNLVKLVKKELSLARDKILVMAICPRDAYKNAGEDEKR